MVLYKFYKNHAEQMTERKVWRGRQSNKNFLGFYARYMYRTVHAMEIRLLRPCIF